MPHMGKLIRKTLCLTPEHYRALAYLVDKKVAKSFSHTIRLALDIGLQTLLQNVPAVLAKPLPVQPSIQAAEAPKVKKQYKKSYVAQDDGTFQIVKTEII